MNFMVVEVMSSIFLFLLNPLRIQTSPINEKTNPAARSAPSILGASKYDPRKTNEHSAMVIAQ